MLWKMQNIKNIIKKIWGIIWKFADNSLSLSHKGWRMGEMLVQRDVIVPTPFSFNHKNKILWKTIQNLQLKMY
jgi:hypothetical protein